MLKRGRVFRMHSGHAQTASRSITCSPGMPSAMHMLSSTAASPAEAGPTEQPRSDGMRTMRLSIPNACSSTASVAAPGPGCQGALAPALAPAAVSIYEEGHHSLSVMH